MPRGGRSHGRSNGASKGANGRGVSWAASEPSAFGDLASGLRVQTLATDTGLYGEVAALSPCCQAPHRMRQQASNAERTTVRSAKTAIGRNCIVHNYAIWAALTGLL